LTYKYNVSTAAGPHPIYATLRLLQLVLVTPIHPAVDFLSRFQHIHTYSLSSLMVIYHVTAVSCPLDANA